ncbi:MAG: hypothetical protein L0Y50_05380 [Beijerinckiaceae bacterium]|nr:hypothetical protein [Beijerinckiaceae bacterium]MCI0735690.1 hypothetical protein [Beijerinckiaceae bacterium]
MQMSFQLTCPRFQLTSPRLGGGAAVAFASLLLLLIPASPRCEPYTSTWASGPKSSLRLIAAGRDFPSAGYRAGVEIQLDPGALTYWRMPGGAGVPPEFSFEGSTNLAEIVVSYPVPMRIVEDGTEVFGYRDHVIFPIRVTPKDSSRPVQLVLNLSYAVCAGICIPGKGEAKLTLLPSQAGVSPDSPETGAIAASEGLVPARLSPQERDAKVIITGDKAAAFPAWRISPRAGTAQDLFAEAPPGWYFDTRATGRPNEFLIVEAVRPLSGGPERPPVILTMKNEQQSYEFTVNLDAASSFVKGVQAAPEAVLRSNQN